MKKLRFSLLISATVWLLVACATQAGGPNGGGGSSVNSGSEPPLPAGSQEAVAAAKKDLSQRIGKPVEQMFVVSVNEVDWSDSSLGCPEPGQFYAQVITPGFRIILSDGSSPYEYHSNRGNHTIRCVSIR